MNIEGQKQIIISSLEEFSIDGMNDLILWMEVNGFFESPASTKYHGCYPGGLAEHSLELARIFTQLNEMASLNIDHETIFLVSILHDLCKVGSYIKEGDIYEYNKKQPPGHATLSLIRIKNYINLKPFEEQLIKFHMGVYQTYEFNKERGEYTFNEMIEAWKDRRIKAFYFCDEFESMQSRKEK